MKDIKHPITILTVMLSKFKPDFFKALLMNSCQATFSFLPLIVSMVIISGCSKEEIIEVDVLPQLELMVIDDAGSVVAGATILLFTSEDDLDSKTNSVQEKTADTNGKVLFSELNELQYYFYVSKGEKNNYYDIVTFNNPLRRNEVRTITCTIK